MTELLKGAYCIDRNYRKHAALVAARVEFENTDYCWYTRPVCQNYSSVEFVQVYTSDDVDVNTYIVFFSSFGEKYNSVVSPWSYDRHTGMTYWYNTTSYPRPATACFL